MDLILKLGGLQAILLSLMLFFRSTDTHGSKRWLAVLLLSLGVASLLYSFHDLSFYLSFPHLIRINWGLPLVFGPLLYLYVRQLTLQQAYHGKYILQHFSPYILNLLLLLPFFLQDGESKIERLDYFTAIITRGTDIYRVYYFMLQIAIAYWGWHYTSLCLPLLKTYRDQLLDNYSEIEKRQVDWLRTIVYGFTALFVLYVLALGLTLGNVYPTFDYEQYFYLGSCLLVYWLTFKSMNLQASNMSLIKEPPIATPPTKSSTDNSLLGEKLLTYLETEKPYLNSELTAIELAQALEVTRHQLSQIMNEELGKNFYDFINTYRVKAFQEMLQDPKFQSYSLLGMALEAGFKSKSSFNAIFKRMTGMTPSQYRKDLAGK